jgi:RNA polymerase sigma-70 factor (ECF subfamily)
MAAAQVMTVEVSSDAELIQRVVGGDEAAFETLYERYFPRVFGFVQKRLDNRADTEETVQEVFINVFSSMASFRGEAPFAAWVLGVARRTIASRFKKKRHATVPFDATEEPETIDIGIPTLHREPTPYEAYECGERLAHLQDRAERQLSREQRQLFQMHHLENHSIHDIALSLNKSEDAVKSNLYRARKLLLAR